MHKTTLTFFLLKGTIVMKMVNLGKDLGAKRMSQAWVYAQHHVSWLEHPGPKLEFTFRLHP